MSMKFSVSQEGPRLCVSQEDIYIHMIVQTDSEIRDTTTHRKKVKK